MSATRIRQAPLSAEAKRTLEMAAAAGPRGLRARDLSPAEQLSVGALERRGLIVRRTVPGTWFVERFYLAGDR